MNGSSLHALGVLSARCFSFAPFKTLIAFGLMLLGSFTSGIGLLMIIPLLSVAGVDLGAGNDSGLIAKFGALTQRLDIDLTLEAVLLIYVALISFMGAINYANSVLSASLQRSFILSLRASTSSALFYTKWRFLNRNHMSDFMRLLTNQIQVTSSMLYVLLGLVSGLILVSVYVCFALVLSMKLTLLAMFFGLLLILINWPFTKYIRASGEKQLLAAKESHRAIFENVSSLKIIKSYAAENRFLEYLASTNKEAEVQQVRISKFNSLTVLINSVGAATIFALLFYSSIRWFDVPLANLLALLFIFSRLMPQITGLQNKVQILTHKGPSYLDLLERINELDDWAEDALISQSQPQANAFSGVEMKNNIVLDNVSYHYMDGVGNAFSSVSAVIERNQTVAIVGPSGVGKSTLADILAGLVDPTEGQMLVDGQPLEELGALSWRQRVAYVTQEVFLFHDTVRANLSWVCTPQHGGSKADLDVRIWKALKSAAADRFVRELPHGLDTQIGDRGVKLSGGERQRLSLARAILSEPDLLILDEATSSLDRENELKIRDSLRELDGKLTIVVIAHNETTIEHVSHRIELG